MHLQHPDQETNIQLKAVADYCHKGLSPLEWAKIAYIYIDLEYPSGNAELHSKGGATLGIAI